MEAREELVSTPSSSSHTSSNVWWLILLIVVCISGYGAYTTTTPKHPVQAQAAAPAHQSAPVSSGQGMSIYGAPSLSAEQINTILRYYGSPATGTGQTFYADSLKYGIDDAFPLAFFFNESTMGLAGMARSTYAIGNERCIPDRACVNNLGGPCESGQSCYAQMQSWSDGIDHWYALISSSLYKGSGLTTIETIIPRYAPSGDNNVPSHYINTVETCVQAWRSGSVEA